MKHKRRNPQAYIFKDVLKVGRLVKRRTNDLGATRFVEEDIEFYDVVAEIDATELMRRLGTKAARNRSGKSSLAWGLVTVWAKPKK